jgi:hypothetical protein
VITVNGNLLANGGNGVGSATDATAEGGSGGRIALSAGVLADEGGSIALGSGTQTVRLDANGGHGTAGGGDASLTAISLAAHGDIDAHAKMQAIGGNTTSVAPGGFGGQGGVVSIASETGNVTLHDTGAPIVAVDGGDGQSETVVIDTNNVAQFGGQGGSAGKLDVTAAGAGKSIQVLGEVSGDGGNGTFGSGGAGGTVTLTAADGAVTIADVHVLGGSGTGEIEFDTDGDGDLDAVGVKGGNGGAVTVSANAGEGEDAVGGGNAFLAGDIRSLGGAFVPEPGSAIAEPRDNNGVAGRVSITSALDITAAPGATAPGIQAGTIDLDGRNVFAGSSAPLVLASSGATGPESFVDSATVTAGNHDDTLASTGNVDVRLDDGLVFDRFEVAERDTRGHVFVRGEDGSALIAEGDGPDGSGTVHTIATIDTQGPRHPLHLSARRRRRRRGRPGRPRHARGRRGELRNQRRHDRERARGRDGAERRAAARADRRFRPWHQHHTEQRRERPRKPPAVRDQHRRCHPGAGAAHRGRGDDERAGRRDDGGRRRGSGRGRDDRARRAHPAPRVRRCEHQLAERRAGDPRC